MIQKKVCMIGPSGVGKTSLVAKFVHSIFSDRYLTTVGVKIDKKEVQLEDAAVHLVLWDLAGDDDFQRLQMSYLRGTAGYLLVADGTRQATLSQALEIHQRVTSTIGQVPFVLVLNKADLTGQWEVDESQIADAAAQGWTVVRTSAKLGTGVDDAFAELTRRMLQPTA